MFALVWRLLARLVNISLDEPKWADAWDSPFPGDEPDTDAKSRHDG